MNWMENSELLASNLEMPVAFDDLLAKFEGIGDQALFDLFRRRAEKLVRVGVDW